MLQNRVAKTAVNFYAFFSFSMAKLGVGRLYVGVVKLTCRDAHVMRVFAQMKGGSEDLGATLS